MPSIQPAAFPLVFAVSAVFAACGAPAQPAPPPASTPAEPVYTGPRVVEIAPSGDTTNGHTCARLADGTVHCWGDAIHLGPSADKEPCDRFGPVPCRRRPGGIAGLAGVAQLAAGVGYTCARLEDGTVRCWGWNHHGELGDGTQEDRAAPTLVPALSEVAEVAVGYGSQTCVRLRDTTVRCWGEDQAGVFGSKATWFFHPIAAVPGLSGVAQLAQGAGQTCVRLADGAVQCWGLNGHGQLGDGTRRDRTTPAPVPGLSGVKQLALGEVHGCALLGDGTVRCWGANFNGQLGDGTQEDRDTPTPVPGLSGVTRLAVGAYHNCALFGDGTAQCWGYNVYGQVGVAPASEECATHVEETPMMGCRRRPTPVQGLAHAAQIAAGAGHTCAVLTSGAVRCWGANMLGQLGDGTTQNRSAPVDVAW